MSPFLVTHKKNLQDNHLKEDYKNIMLSLYSLNIVRLRNVSTQFYYMNVVSDLFIVSKNLHMYEYKYYCIRSCRRYSLFIYNSIWVLVEIKIKFMHFRTSSELISGSAVPSSQGRQPVPPCRTNSASFHDTDYNYL